MRSRLKELMLKKEIQRGERIQQAEIAEATGLDQNTISRWMSPKPLIKIETKVIIRLCEYLDCSVGDLLFLDHSPN